MVDRATRNLTEQQNRCEREFTRIRERAGPGMRLSTSQFYDPFECLPLIGHKKYVCGQLEYRIYRAASVIFLYEEVADWQTRLVCRIERRTSKPGIFTETLLKK